jgi:hypothetical protein
MQLRDLAIAQKSVLTRTTENEINRLLHIECTTESAVVLFDKFPIFIPISGAETLVIFDQVVKTIIAELFPINECHVVTLE